MKYAMFITGDIAQKLDFSEIIDSFAEPKARKGCF